MNWNFEKIKNDWQFDIENYELSMSLGKTSCSVPFCFCSTIGARVMLMKKLNIKSKLINGTRGLVVGYVIKDGINEIFGTNEIFDFQNANENSIVITRRVVSKYTMFDCISIST